MDKPKYSFKYISSLRTYHYGKIPENLACKKTLFRLSIAPPEVNVLGIIG
jgi:hypothetical protein